jgi:hypothetical protein
VRQIPAGHPRPGAAVPPRRLERRRPHHRPGPPPPRDPDLGRRVLAHQAGPARVRQGTAQAECPRNGVPQGPLYDLIRRDLIAARDAVDRDVIPFSVLATGLRFFRVTDLSDEITAPVVAAIGLTASGSDRGVVLGGRLFVSWTLTPNLEQEAVPRPRLSTTMTIGAAMDGMVEAVQHWQTSNA